MFSKIIKEARMKRGFSQEALARKADISYSTLSKLETGKKINPTLKTVELLLIALDITVRIN